MTNNPGYGYTSLAYTYPVPPHSKNGHVPHTCLTKMSGKGVLFRATKSGPQNCKKRGVLTLAPGDFFKKGVFFLFFSHLFGLQVRN